MKILFLCGSLESGRDGVGDYTRRLAGELFRQGHEVSLLALKDKYALNRVEEYQESEGVLISVLRIPGYCSEYERILTAKVFIEAQNPDWLSLQCVLFAFDDKGLPFRISKWLKVLGRGRKWHIMFHELWVGMEVGAPKKFIFWGWIQRQIVFHLIKKLQPTTIHTHTPVYKKQLNKAGIKSKLLPLFSNIPLKSSSVEGDSNKISFVIFGSTHSITNIKQFAKEVALFSINEKTNVVLIMLGRCGDKQKYWLNAWTVEGLDVEILGEQPPELISEVLTRCTFGISTTPIELIEKSGTIAAMREHGLPIISIADDWEARGLPIGDVPDGIYKYEQGCLSKCLSNKRPMANINNVNQVYKILLDDLEAFP